MLSNKDILISDTKIDLSNASIDKTVALIAESNGKLRIIDRAIQKLPGMKP